MVLGLRSPQVANGGGDGDANQCPRGACRVPQQAFCLSGALPPALCEACQRLPPGDPRGVSVRAPPGDGIAQRSKAISAIAFASMKAFCRTSSSVEFEPTNAARAAASISGRQRSRMAASLMSCSANFDLAVRAMSLMQPRTSVVPFAEPAEAGWGAGLVGGRPFDLSTTARLTVCFLVAAISSSLRPNIIAGVAPCRPSPVIAAST